LETDLNRREGSIVSKGTNPILWMFLASMLVVLAIASPALACPNCKEAVSLQPGEMAGVASGYNWSVVFMLTVPFSLLSTGAFMVRRAIRNGSFPEV
jgi:hypothetical protein